MMSLSIYLSNWVALNRFSWVFILENNKLTYLVDDFEKIIVLPTVYDRLHLALQWNVITSAISAIKTLSMKNSSKKKKVVY